MVKEKNYITVFRYNSESCGWDSFYLKNAMLHYCRAISSGVRGVKSSGQTIIRVKIKNPKDIFCGDKVVIGRMSGECPKDALTVVSVTDNNRGSSYVRHYKLLCEG